MDKRQMNIRKGYLKIHIVVDVKSKKILSMKVTIDEHVHDSKVLPELVQNIIKSNNVIAGKLFADGAFNNNDVFRCRADNGIMPVVFSRHSTGYKSPINNDIFHIAKEFDSLVIVWNC